MDASAYRLGPKFGTSERGPTHEEASVLVVHEQFWQSYARRDLDGRFAVCADDVTFFGTGLHERAVGIAQYRAMNEKGVEQYPHAFKIDHIWLEVRLWGDTAWVEGDTYWIMGEGEASTRDIVRQTTILKRSGGRWQIAHVHGSDPDYRLREGEYMTHGNIHARNKELEREVLIRTEELQVEKKRSDELLRNILPEEVAQELMDKGEAEARSISEVTILFTDFKGFTAISEQLTARDLVAELNACFKAFDHIITERGIEKIKTIGDAYMAAGGLPDARHGSPVDVLCAALEMQDFMQRYQAECSALGKPFFEMRAGIHTGPVVAGIVGVKKFQYDIWGDAVNTAARMESSGAVGRVNISAATYARVKNTPGLRFNTRGKVQAKGKGEMEMWFVERA